MLQVLVVQCDPIVCRQTLINQALHVCDQVHAGVPEADFRPHRRRLVFLIHLPPSISDRVRHYSLNFLPGWAYAFVDDIRPEAEVVASDAGINSGVRVCVLNIQTAFPQ